MTFRKVIYDQDDTPSIWKIIIWNMNVYRVTPRQLAQLTGYSIALILKGVKGEPALITDGFLRNCVDVFGATSGRIGPNDSVSISSQLSRQECIDALRPRPAMPTGEKNFWEKDE